MFRYLVSQTCTYLDGWRSQALGLRHPFPGARSISPLSDEHEISCDLKLIVLSCTYDAYDAYRLQFVESSDLQ